MLTKEFFDSTVKPTVEEFLSCERDIRRGRLAAIVLYHVSAYWQLENKTRYERLPILHEFLIGECPDFLLIRDVADVTKHGELTRPDHPRIPRSVTFADQVKPAAPGLFHAPFGEGVFAEASKVTAILNDGKVFILVSAVRSVLSMWERILTEHAT